ncbi:hypothetical protein [Bacillus tuaregi]|uniref:hypothetical protein n=1 Tax=Bacillus tuaregi TaxID=1816695 RepID=UPI0008F8DE33|nr:hypothetical protein [Bacillus tuaregi]
MKKLHSFVFFLLLFGVSACHKDIPEPETKDVSFASPEVVEASNMKVVEDEPLFVKYHVKGKDVYFECIVKGVSFRNGAKLIVSIDGKKTAEYHNAAFIVKGLNPGQHQVTLELYNPNQQALARQQMDLTIK